MIRNFARICKQVCSKRINIVRQKSFYSNIEKDSKITKIVIIGGAVLTLGGLYIQKQRSLTFGLVNSQCSTEIKCQDNVVTLPKKHALYLIIHLKPEANVKEILKIVKSIDTYVEAVCPKEYRDEDDEIHAGVGFGPNFLSKARPSKSASQVFSYHDRKGVHGSMPSTGGDIFIHAKSNEFSKVFELAQHILKHMPANSVERFEDTYGWVYRNGRDLSGFIDGTENPADDEHRTHIAVNPNTGGSFAITQKWIHKHDIINSEKDAVMEAWVGRKRSDSTELSRKSVTSHVARMTGGANFEQKKKFEIVRQSQPFGTLSGESGLFFIAYSSKIDALDYMLDRMIGASDDGLSDDIMRLSKCINSTYWYFPGKKELNEMSCLCG